MGNEKVYLECANSLNSSENEIRELISISGYPISQDNDFDDKLRKVNELYSVKSNINLNDILDLLEIDYIDEKWSHVDWAVVIIATACGSMLDILITQTNILKPIDNKIKEILKSGAIKNIKDFFDKISDWFRDGESAPIDLQDFKMFGLKSIHEQYSFGHDPLRFIEGIIQMMT